MGRPFCFHRSDNRPPAVSLLRTILRGTYKGLKLIFLALPAAIGLLVSLAIAERWSRRSTPATRAKLIRDIEESTDPAVRRAAVSRLWRIKHPDTAPALLKLLGDADENVGRDARDTLKAMRVDITPAVIEALSGPAAKRQGAFWKIAGDLKDPRVLAPAARAMTRKGKAQNKAADAMLSMLWTDEPVDPAAVRVELRPMLDDLLSLATKGSQPVRLASVIALGLLDDRAATPTLLSVLRSGDEDDSIRYEAARALGLIGAVEAVPDLVVALEQEAFLDAAADALQRLGHGREELTARLSAPGLNDWDEPVKLNTIRALGWLGDPQATPTLIELASDPDPHVRRSAASAMGVLLGRVLDATRAAGKRRTGAPQDDEGWQHVRVAILPALERMLDDPDNDVRNVAREMADRARASGR
jgi:HEAT repeat protein